MTAPSLFRRWPLLVLGLLLVAGLAWLLLRVGPMAPVRVTVVSAQAAPLQVSLFGIGTVEARRSYLMGPTSAARVRAVHVEVGQTVPAGTLLAEMDPIDLDDKVQALEASLARAQSSLDAAQAQRDDGRARLALAEANARRTRELQDRGFISPSAMEVRLQELQSAQAGLRAAEANLAAQGHEQHRLVAEKSALLRQRAALRLVAPATAVVTAREAEVGSTVVAGQAVLRLVEPQSLWLRVRLDQGRSQGLTAGLPATIVLRSQPERPLEGRLERVEPLSDSVTEERMAMVAFSAPLPGLSVGELAEVTLRLPEAAPQILVPNSSLQRQGQQQGVWVVEDVGLRFTPVRTGLRGLDGQVQVLDGLRGGEQVVHHSEKALQSDSRLRVVPQLAGARP